MNKELYKIKVKDVSFLSGGQLNKAIKLIKKSLSQPNLFHACSTQIGFNNISALHKLKRFPLLTQKNNITTTNNNTTNFSNSNLEKNSTKIKLAPIKIRQTSVITSKNEHLYKKIFPKKFIERSMGIDNKLNILYSESKEQFDKNLIKRRLEKKAKDHFEHGSSINENESQDRIDKIKSKIDFMKGVSDYSYPQVILFKIKEKQKILLQQTLKRKIHHQSPCERQYENNKKYQKRKTKSLTDSISILNESSHIPKKMFD